MSYGEFRSSLALNSGEGFSRAFVIANQLEHPDEKEAALRHWWRVVDPDLIAPELVWRNNRWILYEKDSLWSSDEREWELSLNEIVIASANVNSLAPIDLAAIQLEWAAIPARHLLSVWENWAKDNLPEYLDVPRECIETIERQQFDLNLFSRCSQACLIISSNYADGDDAAQKARQAASAACQYLHPSSARKAARYASYIMFPDDPDTIYQGWCFKFTAHVFSILKQKELS